MNGFLNVLKPPGMSSHDVVFFLRRKTGVKTGHTGTLDPGAAGVLVLAQGKATKLASFVSGSIKKYRAELKLGKATDTGDSTGNIIREKPGSASQTGTVELFMQCVYRQEEQKPPMYSAAHSGGKRLYKLARKGIEVEREARTIVIYNLELLDFGNDYISFDVTCSKGTYIRVLCTEMAEHLGTVGYMSFLVRTAVGPFTLNESLLLEDIIPAHKSDMTRILIPPDYPLAGMARLELNDKEGLRARNGNPFKVKRGRGIERGLVRLYCRGDFIGLGKVKEENGSFLIKPHIVLA